MLEAATRRDSSGHVGSPSSESGHVSFWKAEEAVQGFSQVDSGPQPRHFGCALWWGLLWESGSVQVGSRAIRIRGEFCGCTIVEFRLHGLSAESMNGFCGSVRPRARSVWSRGGVSVSRHKTGLCDPLSPCLHALFFRFNESSASLFVTVCASLQRVLRTFQRMTVAQGLRGKSHRHLKSFVTRYRIRNAKVW